MKSSTNPDSDVARTLEVDQPHGYGKRLKRWIIVGLLVIVVLAAGVIWRTSGKSDLPQFKTEQVNRGNLTVIVTATGTLQPTNTVDVGSELSGIIKTVKVDYNDRVKVNQILARIDTSKLNVVQKTV